MIDEVFDSALEKKSPLILNHMALGNDDNNGFGDYDGGCAPPVLGYYDCNGRSALETVITNDSYMNENESQASTDNDDDSTTKKDNDEEESEYAEPREPPPPSFGTDTAPPMAHQTSSSSRQQDPHQKRPRSSLEGTKNLTEETISSAIQDLLMLPNGLLAKARGGTSPSFVTNLLDASKRKKQQETSPTSPKNNKPSSNIPNKKSENKHPKPTNSRFVIDAPIKTTTRASASRSKITGDDEDDALIAAARAKWRIAKERYHVHTTLSADDDGGDETIDRYRVHTSISADGETERGLVEKNKPLNFHHNNSTDDDDDDDNLDFPFVKIITKLDDGDVIVEDPSDHRRQEQQQIRRKALDPPGKGGENSKDTTTASTAATTTTTTRSNEADGKDDDDDVESIEEEELMLLDVIESLTRSVATGDSSFAAAAAAAAATKVEHSFSNQDSFPSDRVEQQRSNNGINEGDDDHYYSSSLSSSLYFNTITRSLEQLKDQQTANREMLFEQRLRHQRWKTHRKEEQQKKASLLQSSSLLSMESIQSSACEV